MDFEGCTPPPPSTVNIAFTDTFSIGSTQQNSFNTQLMNTVNYGVSGTYSGVTDVAFTNITSSLATTTAADLYANYDIISTGYLELTSIEADIIRQYVDLGGVVIVLLDSSIGTTVHQEFGGTGSVGSGVVSCTTNSNILNNGVFGTATNITLNGTGSFGAMTTAQLPSGATVLATQSSNPYVWLTGEDNRVVFIWDEGVFRNGVINGAIDTPQEIWCHNIMAYALDKAGF